MPNKKEFDAEKIQNIIFELTEHLHYYDLTYNERVNILVNMCLDHLSKHGLALTNLAAKTEQFFQIMRDVIPLVTKGRYNSKSKSSND
jgi:hypothetical protein